MAMATTTDNRMDSGDMVATILCPLCGTATQSTNDSNLCNNCLRQSVDITQGVAKQLTMMWCRGCERYLSNSKWVAAQLESAELLAVCLKKIKLPKECKMVDASFIWTEPHSRRLKVKLTVQREQFKVILQQSFVVEMVIQNQQCTDCQASYTEHTWGAVVQIRQKVAHKRTFYWLEQLMLKHGVVSKAQNIKEFPDGLDFYWGTKSNANAFVNFLQAVVPLRLTQAKRLISQDFTSNTQKYKFSFMVELASICRDDLVLLPKKVSQSLGGLGPLVVCTKVTALITLTDPRTLRSADLNSTQYFRHNLQPLMSLKSAVEFVVLDVEKQSPHAVNPNVQNSKNKFILADATVVRESDFGVNDTSFEITTHLGHLLTAGDHALGYDLSRANFSGEAVAGYKEELPEVILFKKSFPARRNRARKRRWKLQELPKQRDGVGRKTEMKRAEEDYESFLQQIEEDYEMQKEINIYKKEPGTASVATSVAGGDDDDDGFPGVPLEHMLDSMNIGSAAPAGAGPAGLPAALGGTHSAASPTAMDDEKV